MSRQNKVTEPIFQATTAHKEASPTKALEGTSPRNAVEETSPTKAVEETSPTKVFRKVLTPKTMEFSEQRYHIVDIRIFIFDRV
jgi:hypothetical protein